MGIRARFHQPTAAVRQAIDPLHGGEIGANLEDVFERWESRIVTSELDTGEGRADGIDRLEREFDRAEAEAALREELAALRGAKE